MMLSCNLSSVVLSGSSSVAGVTYSWVASNGGNIVSGANTATPLVNAVGTYTLTVTNPANGCSGTDVAMVTESINAPGAMASANGQLTCTTATITISGSSNATNVTYAWSGPNGFTSNSQTASVTDAGTYVLTVTSLTNGCVSTAAVEVQEDTTTPIILISGPAEICLGSTAVLTASGGESYSWSTGETAPTIVVSPTEDTTYSVTVTAENGCTDSASFTVAVAGYDEQVYFEIPDFCAGAPAPTPIGTGFVEGGIFIFDNAVSVGATINAQTGIISNAVAGTTYIVNYTTPPPCQTGWVTTVTALDCGEECAVVNAGTVSDLVLCNAIDGAFPSSGQLVSTGQQNGIWTITPLTPAFNPATGVFNALLANVGTYQVSYLVVNPDLSDGTICPDAIATATVTVVDCEVSTCPLTDVNALPGACQVNSTATNGTITGTVWYDLNDDGIQNFGEPGTPQVGVSLINLGADGIVGTNDDSVVTTTTDIHGNYAFNNLPSGLYLVNVSTPTNYYTTIDETENNIINISSGSSVYDLTVQVFSDGTAGNFTVVLNGNTVGSYAYTGTTTIVTLSDLPANGTTNTVQVFDTTSGNCIESDSYQAPSSCTGTNYVDLDTGILSQIVGSISNFVWYDLDADGMQDPNEPGVANVHVTLYTADGTPYAETYTDENGYYSFVNLPLGDYYVVFDIPEGYTVTAQNATADNMDSDIDLNGHSAIVSITNTINDVTVDAGIIPDYGVCSNFTAEAKIKCDSTGTSYTIHLNILGGDAGDNGYYISSSSGYIGFVPSVNSYAIVNDGHEYANQEGYNYTITVVDHPECVVTVSSPSVSCDHVTALELIRFEGEVQEKGNMLYWVTATEKDNDYFILERSLDGMNFEAIGEVDAVGNSSTPSYYDFLDKEAPIGLAYYRLRAVDIYGVNEIVSHVVLLSREQNYVGVVDVSPVPTLDEVNITYSNDIDANVTLIVWDLTGRVVKQQTADIVAGINTISLDLENLPAGAYLVQVLNQEKSEILKVIKE
ncbi:MAG: SdrD B-like domain-containing protein [Chitinophagales bacterium]